MKVTRLFPLFLLISLVFTSCKNETNEATVQTPTKTETTPVKSVSVATGSLMEKVMSHKELKSFASATVTTGISEMLIDKSGPYTILAPSNEAFKLFSNDSKKHFFNPKNKEDFATLLKNHILEENIGSADLLQRIRDKGTLTLETIGDATLKASLKDGVIILKDENGGEAIVGTSDIQGANGVVHVIDKVLNTSLK